MSRTACSKIQNWHPELAPKIDFTQNWSTKLPRTVPLYGPKAASRVALVDDEDYELVQNYAWYLWEDTTRPGRPNGPYAVAQIWRPDGTRGRSMRMHMFLTGWPRTDHIDGDGLNNQRSNLRPATHAQNMRNSAKAPARFSSRFKGVSWMARRQVWVAMIWDIGKNRYLGSFKDEEDAARAYNLAARDAYGEFARFNDVDPLFP